MDVPPPVSKPKIKKEKSDKTKTPVENPNGVPNVNHTQPASVGASVNTSKPIPSGPSASRPAPALDTQKDLAQSPKVVPSKRPSDVPPSSAPNPEAKRPHLNGNASTKPQPTSAPNRPTPNGTNTPKGLPRPAPPPGRPPPPPPAPTRPAEDVLFIKKKKVSR
jgi:hypothetical protein